MRASAQLSLIALGRRLRAFARNRRGNIGLVVAVGALVLVAGVGVGLDYARETVQFDAMQAAVDAAALAAANAANAGASTASATQTADKVFALDFTPSPSCGSSGVGGGGASNTPPGVPVPTVNVVSVAGVVTTTVSYQASMQTLFGALTGTPCMTQSATATAQANVATALYSAAGGIWGDPEVFDGDGSQVQLNCGGDPNGWYDLLSDSQFEINGSCYAGWTFGDFAANSGVTVPAGASPATVGESYLGGVEILMGSHVVSFNTTLLPDNATNNPHNVYHGLGNVLSVWNGAVTIDGVTYTPNLTSASSYLGGSVTGQPLTATSALTASGQCAGPGFVNFVCLEMAVDPQILGLNVPYFYTIKYGAYEVQVYYREDGARVNLWATNTGACGAPGGVWGETLVGAFDSNSQDFLMSGPTAEAPQFANTSCPTTSQTNAHLIMTAAK